MFLTRIASVALTLPVLLGSSPPAQVDPDAVIQQTLAQAVEIPRQAAALTKLAWPEQGPRDEQVAERARAELVAFGEHGMAALRVAITSVRPEHQAEVVSVFIKAHRMLSAGIHPEFQPGLEEAAWSGTEEARRLAIPELARYRYRPAMLTIIDTAYEYPSLAQLCIEALGSLRDDHARFFLEKTLNEGKPEIAAAAATALAQIGGRALLPLKAAMRSENQALRVAAARAFLPVAGVDDLSSLHEYVATHPDDHPDTVKAVRDAALMLEKARQAKEAAEAAGASPEPEPEP